MMKHSKIVLIAMLLMQLCILKTGANTITIVDGITLDMAFRNSSSIAFTVTGPNAKWTAIGLGQGMTNVDMFVLDPGSGTAQIINIFDTITLSIILIALLLRLLLLQWILLQTTI